MKTLDDFKFGDIVVDHENDIMVVVSLQPNNGMYGAVICFMEDDFTPIVCDPNDLTHVTTNDDEIDGIAHEIWAVAQLLPEEGILDGVDRIVEILKREFVKEKEGGITMGQKYKHYLSLAITDELYEAILGDMSKKHMLGALSKTNPTDIFVLQILAAIQEGNSSTIYLKKGE